MDFSKKPKTGHSKLQVICFIHLVQQPVIYNYNIFHLLYTGYSKRSLCRFQNTCKFKQCKYLHVKSALLKGKKKPYILCKFFPNCTNQDCKFVHVTKKQLHCNKQMCTDSDPVSKKEEETNDTPQAVDVVQSEPETNPNTIGSE